MSIGIFLILVCIALILVLIIFGCVLLSKGELEGLISIALGLILTLPLTSTIYDLTKPLEKQFAEKQKAVIEAQMELEKFLIDHPELKESK